MDSIPRPDIDWNDYERRRAEGITDKAHALSIGETPNNFAQKKRRHYRRALSGAGRGEPHS
jgi:hypothetical protein